MGGQVQQRAHYSPPWANTSIIGVAGSSGSGKTSLAIAIRNQLSLPWVVILSMVGSRDPETKTDNIANITMRICFTSL
jgi:uridine kinase